MNTELVSAEAHETPGAIRSTLTETLPQAEEAAAAMHQRNPRRIYITGNGTSLYSSMAASYTARALARVDDPLVLAAPAGDFRYFTPSLSQQDVVVGISASGEFRDILAIFERVKGQCLCVGITQVPGSSITRLADITLFAGGGLSQVPVMTKTYASTLTAAHLLLMAFFDATGSTYQALSQVADCAEEAIGAAEQIIPGIVNSLAGFEHAFHYGAGPAFAASLETALKMKEMALLHAEGAETWEMASGPATIVSPASFCVSLTTGGSTDAETAQVTSHTRAWGAPIIEIGPRPSLQAEAGVWHIPVRAPVFEPLASLALVPPAVLLAYRLARARGVNPDQPSWRERYISQGMTHIIGE